MKKAYLYDVPLVFSESVKYWLFVLYFLTENCFISYLEVRADALVHLMLHIPENLNVCMFQHFSFVVGYCAFYVSLRTRPQDLTVGCPCPLVSVESQAPFG